MKKLLLTSVLCFVLVLGSAVAAQAAVISWGAATNVGSASDIRTDGTLVEAYNAAHSSFAGSVSVNGVSFTHTAALYTGNNNSDFFSGTTGDAGYNTVLSTLDFGGGGGLTTLNLGEGDGNGADNGGGNLVLGKQYLIQVWFTDDRGGSLTRVMEFGDGNGNTVDLKASATETAGVPGQYAIGTFTADATMLQVLTSDPQGFGNSHINAYQIRQIPEPSTYLVFGGLMLCFGAAGWWRKRQQQAA